MVFKSLVIDPPWAYRNVKTGGSMRSGSAAHYQTLTPDQIFDLPIVDIMDRNSIVFLWVPTPILDLGFDALDAWGFKYKTALYWLKFGRKGMGYWFSGNVENLLLGVRGKVPAFRCQRSNVVAARPRKHSQKPDEMMERIEPYCLPPRLEMFCRGTPRNGWIGWGHECTEDANIVELDDYMESLSHE